MEDTLQPGDEEIALEPWLEVRSKRIETFYVGEPQGETNWFSPARPKTNEPPDPRTVPTGGLVVPRTKRAGPKRGGVSRRLVNVIDIDAQSIADTVRDCKMTRAETFTAICQVREIRRSKVL